MEGVLYRKQHNKTAYDKPHTSEINAWKYYKSPLLNDYKESIMMKIFAGYP
jgi:hypothetical protein